MAIEKISVIVPTYNEQQNIKNTLENIKKQICSIPYEIIVVDGQSTDNTVSIAKKLVKTYISPIKGKAEQLNYGVDQSTGDILVFLDADTLIDQNFLRKIYKLFEKYPNLLACSPRVKYYNGKILSLNFGNKTITLTTYFFLNLCMHIFYFFKTQLRFPELMGCSIIVRRDAFLQIGGFKRPPNNLGIDKLFSDSLIYLKRKTGKGKIKTLNSISVLTSGRFLSAKRSINRISLYHSKKDLLYEMAKDIPSNFN